MSAADFGHGKTNQHRETSDHNPTPCHHRRTAGVLVMMEASISRIALTDQMKRTRPNKNKDGIPVGIEMMEKDTSCARSVGLFGYKKMGGTNSPQSSKELAFQ